MSGAILNIGRLNDNLINRWGAKFDKGEDGFFYCKVCGSEIMQTTCYVSIHTKLFEPQCVGSGRVEHINYPYCPKCDGSIDYVRACYHTEGLTSVILVLSRFPKGF